MRQIQGALCAASFSISSRRSASAAWTSFLMSRRSRSNTSWSTRRPSTCSRLSPWPTSPASIAGWCPHPAHFLLSVSSLSLYLHGCRVPIGVP
ncbi:unnamed protein product, partial [Musa acuminata subsp. malaccensis]